MPLPLSAQACKVRINGAILYNSAWNAVPDRALLDTSNMEGGGFEDQIGGLSKFDAHVEGWWDAAANMYLGPLFLFDGSIITYILYTSGIGSPAWQGTAIVKGALMKVDVHGLVLYTMDFKAKGAFLYPGQ